MMMMMNNATFSKVHPPHWYDIAPFSINFSTRDSVFKCVHY